MGSQTRIHSPKRAPKAGTKVPGKAAPRVYRAGLGFRVRGERAWIWAHDEAGAPSALGLASALAEHERDAPRVEVVTLCVRDRHDARWLPAVIDWLEAHGRGVVLRTRVRLPREFVLSLRGRPVAMELELASLDARVQRALLGEGAAAANELLLQAQHFAVLGLEVGARLGPLLPGVHELPAFEALVAAVRAADVHAVDLQVGHLSAPVLGRLHKVLDGGAMMLLMRAFRLPPTAAFDLDFASRALPSDLSTAIVSRFGAVVRDAHDVRMCSLAQQQAQRHRGAHREVLQPSLFGDQFGDELVG